MAQAQRFHQHYFFSAKQKNFKKMTEVLSLFEEEGLSPKPRTLRYVAKVFQGNDQPVPFPIPEVQEVGSISCHCWYMCIHVCVRLCACAYVYVLFLCIFTRITF